MIHIFSGDNRFELLRAVDERAARFINEHGDLAVERLDGSEATPAQVVDAMQSLPFLSTHKLVIIKGLATKELLELVAKNIPSVPETTELILVADKLDKRAGYYKILSKLPGFKVFEVSNASHLPSWVVEYTAGQGGHISLQNARYLIDRLGPNQAVLSQEIAKLVTYDPAISQESIDLLCDPAPQATAFQLLEAAIAGNQPMVEKLYREQRAQKVEPLALIGLFGWQLHIVAVVKAAEGKSAAEIAREAGINPYVVKKSQAAARRFSWQQLKDTVRRASELDIALKSSSLDADDALLHYLMTLT